MQATYEISRERDENILYAETDGVCPYHFHRKVEIMYVLEGKKEIIAGGKEIELESDNIFIANSYCLHSYKKSSNSKQIIIVFPNRMLAHFYKCFSGDVLKSNVIEDKEVCRALKPLVLSLANRDVNPLLYQAQIDLLLGAIVETVGVEEGNATDRQSFVERVLDYIDSHYAENISLDDMAEDFGYSKYYFSHIFNSVLGTSITDYISTIRLNKALEMLRREKCTVAQAAYESGFSSIPTFYRALKKNYTYKNIGDLL